MHVYFIERSNPLLDAIIAIGLEFADDTFPALELK